MKCSFYAVLTTLFLCLEPYVLSGQVIAIDPKIQFKGKLKSNKLLLRWVVYDQNKWYEGLANGYQLNRYSVEGNTRILDWTKKINKRPANTWDRNSDSLSVSETTYDLLYSSDQALINSLPRKSNGNAFEYTNAETKETRYLLSLFLANDNYQSALWQGVAYEDQEIDRKKIYEYVLISRLDSSVLRYNASAISEATLPVRPDIKVDESKTQLTWDAVSRYTTYHSYWIEISGNARQFHFASYHAISNYTDNAAEKGYSSTYAWSDSLYPGEVRWYRLRGVDYFGELNPPGPMIKMEYPRRVPAPIILNYEIINQQIKINWRFLQEYEPEVDYFQVWTAVEDTGLAIMIQDKVYKSQRSTYIPLSSDQVRYIYIYLVRRNGVVLKSFPLMVTPIDSQAPQRPAFLQGSCDSTGHVKILWLKNKEPDVDGYRVFRSNAIQDEFSQITYDVWTDTIYIDSIDLNHLNKTIYYKVACEDHVGNLSDLSEPLEVIKFDRIPPTPPQFYTWKPGIQSIQLYWYNSSSKDAAEIQLYRKKISATDWELLHSFRQKDSSMTYIDYAIHEDSLYQYKLLCIDGSGNVSVPSEIITVQAQGPSKYPAIEHIESSYDSITRAITLSWKYPYDGVREYWIYRSMNDQPITLLMTLDGIVHQWKDTGMIKNKQYAYRIKAIFDNGKDSYFSKKIWIKVE